MFNRVVFMVWRAALSFTGWNRCLMGRTTLWRGRWLTHWTRLEGSSCWDQIVIITLADIWHGSQIYTLSDLQSYFSLSTSQFHHLQIRHALAPYTAELQGLPGFNPLEVRLVLRRPGQRWGFPNYIEPWWIMHSGCWTDCITDGRDGLVSWTRWSGMRLVWLLGSWYPPNSD